MLTSCMHLVMVGTHPDNEDGHSSGASAPVFEKEVLWNDVRASATFPPIQTGKETLFSLKLTDIRSGAPLSGAKVTFHASYLHGSEMIHDARSHLTHTTTDSSHMRSTGEHSVNFEQEVQESSQPGIYAIAFRGPQEGQYRLMFHISAIGEQKLEREITIEAQQTAVRHKDHSSGMMGAIGGASIYVIIGAAVVGAVMLAVWVSGGGMI